MELAERFIHDPAEASPAAADRHPNVSASNFKLPHLQFLASAVACLTISLPSSGGIINVKFVTDYGDTAWKNGLTEPSCRPPAIWVDFIQQCAEVIFLSIMLVR